MHPNAFRFMLSEDRKINWRNIESIDIPKVLGGDIRSLKLCTDDIAYADLASDDFIQTRPEVYKMHRLAQMGIQYLLHTRTYLKGQCEELNTGVAQEEKNVRKLKKLIKSQKTKLKKLRAEQEHLDQRAQHYDLISDALRPDLPKDLDFKQVEQQKLEQRGVYLSKLKESVTETAKELQTLEEGELSEVDFDLSVTQSHGVFASGDFKKGLEVKIDAPEKPKEQTTEVDAGVNRFNSPAVASPY